MISWLLLFFASAHATCPTYACETFSDDLCLKWTTDAVSLNSAGCQVYTLTCSLSQALVAYQASPNSGNYTCQEIEAASDNKTFNYCGEREDSQRFLAEGEFPKECTAEGYSDAACLLVDGSHDECRCGMDSKLYCQPSFSDVPFDFFWEECDDLDDVVSSEFYSYYDLLSNFYIEYNTAPDCANRLFYEFGILSEPMPQPEYDAAEVLMAGAFTLVLLG